MPPLGSAPHSGHVYLPGEPGSGTLCSQVNSSNKKAHNTLISVSYQSFKHTWCSQVVRRYKVRMWHSVESAVSSTDAAGILQTAMPVANMAGRIRKRFEERDGICKEKKEAILLKQFTVKCGVSSFIDKLCWHVSNFNFLKFIFVKAFVADKAEQFSVICHCNYKMQNACPNRVLKTQNMLVFLFRCCVFSPSSPADLISMLS